MTANRNYTVALLKGTVLAAIIANLGLNRRTDHTRFFYSHCGKGWPI
jgi:hypothetical protein